MNKKNNRGLIPSQGGMVSDLILRFKLIARLMADKRVSFWPKLLPIGAVAYLISPIDLIPGGVIPIIGAVDDVAILWFGVSLFVQLCPPDVVSEHMRQLSNDTGIVDTSPPPEGEVIDAEVTDVKDE
jgi:uncharacterized membrane protein YkvA (DUF1232 family)